MSGKRTFRANTFRARTFANATWAGAKAARPIHLVVDEATAFYAQHRGRGMTGERERGLMAADRGRGLTSGRPVQ